MRLLGSIEVVVLARCGNGDELPRLQLLEELVNITLNLLLIRRCFLDYFLDDVVDRSSLLQALPDVSAHRIQVQHGAALDVENHRAIATYYGTNRWGNINHCFFQEAQSYNSRIHREETFF